jgi:two-component system CitB family response regulator
MIRLVIAEDDTQIAEIQRRFVERIDGFETVGVAHTTSDAKDLVEVLQPDLLILDIHFPGGNGLELLRELRASNSGTDVVLVTAAREVDVLTSALRCGVFDYIVKPLVFERLSETLENFRQHRARIQSLDALNQSDVDRLLPRASPSAVAGEPRRLPKGIDALTLEKVRQVLFEYSGHDGMNAEAVGEKIGVSRTTARRYLEHMVSEHELFADVSYGTVGRPERRYFPQKGAGA